MPRTSGQIQEIQRVLTYQRDITRSAVRDGLQGPTTLLARELGADVVVLDEYGVVMAASSRRTALLTHVNREYLRLSRGGRPGAHAVEVAEGTLELQMIQGRSGVCGWLAVLHRTPASHTDRLLLNQAAGLMTLQLDWPAELIETYHTLGGTLLSLILDVHAFTPGLERHLRHFGFDSRDNVVLAVATADRDLSEVEEVVATYLEKTKRPHVVAQVGARLAILVPERDRVEIVDALVEEFRTAELCGVVLGVSGQLQQGGLADGLRPAVLAADAARRHGEPVGWFDDLALAPVVDDPALRDRVVDVTSPALRALRRSDLGRDAELVPSLRAFLNHNGSLEAAAREIGVHRHTLKSRVDRVEELTGMRLDRADHRALLLLGLMSEPVDGS